jgi:hypothetical protein
MMGTSQNRQAVSQDLSGDRNENEIEYGDSKQSSFPRPITVHRYGRAQEHKCTSDSSPRRNAKESQSGTDGNELGDQRQEIANAQVDHGEPAPKRPKAVKDQLRMTVVRGGTQPHGNLLYDDCHAKRENDEGNEEPNSKSRARCSVGNHAWAVVLSQHDENSGSYEQPQQAELGEGTPLGARRRNTDTVMRTINVLVGDNDIFFGGRLAALSWTEVLSSPAIPRSALRFPGTLFIAGEELYRYIAN